MFLSEPGNPNKMTNAAPAFSDKITALYQSQKTFFESGTTLSYSFRRDQLKKLKEVVIKYEHQVLAALKEDFSKPDFEGYATEVGFLLEEINYTLKHLRSWMDPERVSSPLTSWPSRSYILPHPKGVTLIIGPWNYPFQLALAPVVAAISAGNTAIIKPPEQTPKTSALIHKMISENFDSRVLAVVEGEGQVVVPELINNHRFDHIFFTGSTGVGRKIAEMAAPHLTPVTLELGGKSPAIIDKTANLKVAAKRIAFGKWVNAGQTCVAPDYLLVHKSVHDRFVDTLKSTINRFYGDHPLGSDHLASLINKRHFDTQLEYLSEGKIIFGGKADHQKLRIEPTLITDVKMEDRLMSEEIFGPVLPILTFETEEQAKAIIAENPNPLSLYVFTSSSKFEKSFTKTVAFGGGAVNNAIVHLSNPELPFGGIGGSGYGSYHGKSGFDVFSHKKGIMKTATWFDLAQKYPPYGNFALRLIRWLMR